MRPGPRAVHHRNPPATARKPRLSIFTDDEAAELEIEDFAYEPACATIAKGQALEIRNRDNFSHTFTVDALDITIPIDGDATITMANRGKEPKLAVGTNPFHCSIHPEMTGTIFVTG